MEYYKGIKKNEICRYMQIYEAILHKIQMQELENTVLSEATQTQKDGWMLNGLSYLWIPALKLQMCTTFSNHKIKKSERYMGGELE